MPPKLNLTPEELAARKRARASERMRRYAARQLTEPSLQEARDRKTERARLWRLANPDKAAAGNEKLQKNRRAARAEADALARENPEWQDHRRMSAEKMSPLGRVVDNEMRISRKRLRELAVLSALHDPFLFDRDKIHEDSRWLAEHFPPGISSIYIRGLHYRLVAKGSVVKPNGNTYINDEESYAWLNDIAKSARWLGYIPFERIIDNRNDEPVTVLPDPPASAGYAGFDSPCHVEMPDFDLSGPPEVTLSGVHVPQPYRIILIGEKSSLREELEPIRQLVNAELIMPSGEISDTLVYDMAARAAADRRSSVVLYFSDFDPSGYNMPVSLSRRLQALRILYWNDLKIQVYAVALDLETCIRLDLPSTPLKETELRADDWRERFGREQTEIDALLALHPGELTRIAREAVEPFFDFTLGARLASAYSDWHGAAESILNDSDAYQAEVRLLAERQDEAKKTIREAIGDANLAIDAAVEQIDAIGLEFDPFEPPEVEITANAPKPLFDSNNGTWGEQTQRLREHKALGSDGDDETPETREATP